MAHLYSSLSAAPAAVEEINPSLGKPERKPSSSKCPQNQGTDVSPLAS